MKIKYVQLESQAFLTDLDFVTMSAAERGVYCTLLLHLYCNGGKCELDPIMNPPPGMLCDHKNHNTVDNRKSNLRICTPAQNRHNQLPQSGGTSRYKGVHWHKDNCRWQARIGHKGKLIHLGYYDYEADAAIAYDDMAIDLFGEFACLNFDHRPEIKLWMEATYLFTTTRNELAGTERG